MVRKLCLGPKVDMKCFVEIINRFEECGKDRKCIEICMKEILMALMNLAKDPQKIRIVENALRIAVAAYKYQIEPLGQNINYLTPRDKNTVLNILRQEYGN